MEAFAYRAQCRLLAHLQRPREEVHVTPIRLRDLPARVPREGMIGVGGLESALGDEVPEGTDVVL